MVQLGRRGWVTGALVAEIFGYMVPAFQVRFFPVVKVYNVWSVWELTIRAWTTYTPLLVRFLLPLPLVLACVGWAGYMISGNHWHLRYGFLPGFGLGIGIGLLVIFVALFGDLLLPFNGILFLASAFASNRSKT